VIKQERRGDGMVEFKAKGNFAVVVYKKNEVVKILYEDEEWGSTDCFYIRIKDLDKIIALLTEIKEQLGE